MNAILKNIETIRKEKGIKQAVIAERLGINQGTYSQLFTRNTDIKYQKILQIADILEVSVIDIITYPDKYVIEKDLVCEKCNEKDLIINNLNSYIELLKKQLKSQSKK